MINHNFLSTYESSLTISLYYLNKLPLSKIESLPILNKKYRFIYTDLLRKSNKKDQIIFFLQQFKVYRIYIPLVNVIEILHTYIYYNDYYNAIDVVNRFRVRHRYLDKVCMLLKYYVGMGIKCVNIESSKVKGIEGVNDMESRLEGVSNSSGSISVSYSTDALEGVNDRDSKQQGVSNSTDMLESVNNSTSNNTLYNIISNTTIDVVVNGCIAYLRDGFDSSVFQFLYECVINNNKSKERVYVNNRECNDKEIKKENKDNNNTVNNNNTLHSCYPLSKLKRKLSFMLKPCYYKKIKLQDIITLNKVLKSDILYLRIIYLKGFNDEREMIKYYNNEVGYCGYKMGVYLCERGYNERMYCMLRRVGLVTEEMEKIEKGRMGGYVCFSNNDKMDDSNNYKRRKRELIRFIREY